MNTAAAPVARKRIDRTLLMWFLLLSLVPLLIISLIAMNSARDGLRQAAIQTLVTETQQNAQHIRDYIDRVVGHLAYEADQDNNIAFMQALNRGYRDSGRRLGDYVGSYPWALLVHRYAAGLQDLRLLHGYHDVYFIGTGGELLYSLAGRADLGTDLFRGRYSHSRFAAAVRRALDTGRTAFSDLEAYAPAGGMVSGFMVAPVVDRNGNEAGAMALSFTIEETVKAINAADARKGQGNFLYIIGADLTLRSAALGHTGDFLRQRVETDLTRRHDHRGQKAGRHGGESGQAVIYTGPAGRRMIGAIQHLDLPDTEWAVVAEMETRTAFASVHRMQYLVFGLGLLTAVLVIGITLPITRAIVRPIQALTGAIGSAREGDLDQRLEIRSDNELGLMAQGFNSLMRELRNSRDANARQQWLQQGASGLVDRLRGDKDLPELARDAIGFLCRYLEADMGAFYVVRDGRIHLTGSYAFTARKAFRNEFAPGEGIVGQAALERQPLELRQVPEDYLAIGSGLGETLPRRISVTPLIWNDQVVALLEFATLDGFNAQQQELLQLVGSRLAAAVLTTLGRHRTEQLLLQTRDQAEALQVREEELRDSNVLLEQQAEELKRSEEGLRGSQAELEEKNEQLQVQQEELRIANAELQERAGELEQSRRMVEQKNRDLEEATRQISRRAEELKSASQYKSEFLANMSHELRTPLNSLLILAKLLGDNREGNLNAQQREYAASIHDSGHDLLGLINDILDLSKIEAGRMEVHLEAVSRDEFLGGLERKFHPLAADKGIGFRIDAGHAPESWRSDGQKLGQVLKNLLANAVKFTERGSVTLRVGPEESSAGPAAERERLKFSVIDTGIGIPGEKLEHIFEAFQQADGTTSRKFGGTGLGLAISRRLVQLLGGEIRVQSEPGRGSCFDVLIPLREIPPPALPHAAENSPLSGPTPAAEAPAPATGPAPPTARDPEDIPDDRRKINPEDRVILIVEDDRRFARILTDVAAGRGFKVLVAGDGESALQLADFHRPGGIIMDIGLPGMDGLEVMERLKGNLRTRHIPVHFISARESRLSAMRGGAVGFLTKPVTLEQVGAAFERLEDIMERPVKRLLLVEDDPQQQQSIRELIGNGDVETRVVATGHEAEQLLERSRFDCMVLDLGLPDMNGTELLEWIRTHPQLDNLPVVIYTGRELEPGERAQLDHYAQSIIIKDACSPERLLDDTALFLHRLQADLPEDRRKLMQMLHDTESLFKGRKVLLVDDDMRNLFALSAVLQEKEMRVVAAKNGREALERLERNPDTALVLMDIMMPEMDGYEAIRRIRAQQRFADLPVIALTAKAMKGDRARCIEVGASDYLAKPVDTERLISMMRVWLYQ